MLAEIFQAIRMRSENHEGNSASSQVLLISEICINCYQDIEFNFRQSQEFAILSTGPSRFLNS